MNELRVGRKVGRTIYQQQGEAPSDDDPLVGMMDTRELAQAVVDAYNVLVAVRTVQYASKVAAMREP